MLLWCEHTWQSCARSLRSDQFVRFSPLAQSCLRLPVFVVVLVTAAPSVIINAWQGLCMKPVQLGSGGPIIDHWYINTCLQRCLLCIFLRFCNFEWIEKMAEEVDEDAHGRDDKVSFLFFGLFARFFQARPSHFKISLRSCSPERTSTLPPTSTWLVLVLVY